MPARSADNSDNPLQAGPVKDYSPPSLPTLEEARDTQMPMPLPSRWRKGAAVLACVGVMGALAVLGGVRGNWTGEPVVHYCPVNQPEEYALAQIIARIEAADLDVRVHFGGFGGAPIYLAYITEQEAMNYIIARLELAGLRFDTEPPEYNIVYYHFMSGEWREYVDLALFDEDRRVGVATIFLRSHSGLGGRSDARRVAGIFAEQHSDITVGAFYNPGGRILIGRRSRINSAQDTNIPRIRANIQREQGRPEIIEQLNAQIDAFIALLQEQGKL